MNYNNRNLMVHLIVIDEEYRDIIISCEDQIYQLINEDNLKINIYNETIYNLGNIHKFIAIDPQLTIGNVAEIDINDRFISLTFTIFKDNPYENIVCHGCGTVIPRVIYNKELNIYRFICFDLKMEEK